MTPPTDEPASTPRRAAALARRHLRQEVVLFIGEQAIPRRNQPRRPRTTSALKPPGKRSGIGGTIAVEDVGLVEQQGRDVGNVGVALVAERGGQRLVRDRGPC